MRFNEHQKGATWIDKFAWFPITIDGVTIWLERYSLREGLPYRKLELYQGCAERVGYPCDCYRH